MKLTDYLTCHKNQHEIKDGVLHVSSSVWVFYDAVTSMPDSVAIQGYLNLENCTVPLPSDELILEGYLNLSNGNFATLPESVTIGTYLRFTIDDLHKMNKDWADRFVDTKVCIPTSLGFASFRAGGSVVRLNGVEISLNGNLDQQVRGAKRGVTETEVAILLNLFESLVSLGFLIEGSK